MNSVIELAGGENIAKDIDARFTTMVWESVVSAKPDVIAVMDYNKQPLKDKLKFLREASPLKDSEAVKNNKIYAMPYGEAVKNNKIYAMSYGEAVSNPRTISAAERLAEYLENNTGGGA